jgi:hypothetical protein
MASEKPVCPVAAFSGRRGAIKVIFKSAGCTDLAGNRAAGARLMTSALGLQRGSCKLLERAVFAGKSRPLRPWGTAQWRLTLPSASLLFLGQGVSMSKIDSVDSTGSKMPCF